MPRIPDEEIQRLKREVSLVRLCERYGIDLKPQGKNLVGFCPWHKDDKPSFIVTPEKNLWHCMGACDQGGDVFSLVQKAEKVSFRRAADILLEISGSMPKSQVIRTPAGTKHQILVNPDDGLADIDLMNHVTDFYHRAFMSDPKAMKYLESRHCMHPEAVRLFTIGYANRTLGYRVPGTTAGGKRLKARLKGIGVMRKSGHEHLSGSVVFPIMDLNGNPVQMYGRKITAGLRKGTPEHLYLEQPMAGVWNLTGVANQKEWILCECIIDALTLWCHGLRNVTCCFGKNTVTDDMWSVLRKIRPTKITIAFDNDPSGNKAAEKLAPKLASQGANVYRLKVAQGKDINEYVCMLAGKDKKAIPGILQGMLVDAPIMHRADPGSVDIAVLEPMSQETESSSSICSLAANKKTATKEKTIESAAKPDLRQVQTDTAAKQKTDSDIKAVKKGEDIQIAIGDRAYRIRGFKKNQTFDVMRVNMRVMNPASYHIDTLDLYNARQRTAYINTAAEELQTKADILKKDLGRVLLKLEELQDEQINKTLESNPEKPEMTEAERRQALALLKSPDLLDQILNGFNTYGLVGERTNKLTGYLAAVSRKLDKPLAVVVQSSSASGKSTLMEAVLDMMPEEDRIQYSAMTGQSLFYFGDKNLKHKILAIVEEEGVRQASYALKLLQSEGKLTIASTGKDNATGQMVTKEYHVEGPVMIFTTTTAIDIDEELLNRCIILTIDESREQTKAIHRQQRKSETLEGLIKKLDKKDVLKVQRNAQRLLAPLEVINPYADDLTFLDDNTRTRRDHKKYLTLIRANAFLHQYQRPIKVLVHNGEPVRYIEATLADIKIANELASEALGRSLDELPPQTRRFLDFVTQMVQAACKKQSIDRSDFRFTQRDIRTYTGWSDYQVKSHLKKLVSLEYVLVHHGGRGQQFVYELLYNGEGKDGEKFLMSLIDVNELKKGSKYDPNREHSKQDRVQKSHDREHEKPKQEVSRSIQGASKEHPESMGKNDSLLNNNEQLDAQPLKPAENAYIGAISKPDQSYRSHTSLAAGGND
jgi:DNA primase catalytic core